MRYANPRLGWWVALGLAGCATPKPLGQQAPAGPVAVVPPAPPRHAEASDTSVAAVAQAPKPPPPPAAAPYVPGPERRIHWYGLSLDLNNVWNDQTEYAFESASGPIQQVVFKYSELEPAQARPWLQEVRSRLDGAFGAKASGVQPYENPSYFVLGVQARIKQESLYFLFATVDDKVVEMTARCRSECDAALRRLVRSLKKQEATVTGAAEQLKGAQQRYRAGQVLFDSGAVFETPNEFVLQHAEETAEERIFCKRQPQPPADAELPPEVHWSYDATQALLKAPRAEETLTGKSSDAHAAVVHLYRREATASDGGEQNVPFSSNSAVVSIGSEILHCYELAGPSSAGLMARFHRLFESARYE